MIKNLRPEIKSISKNYMPEIVSDLAYNFKKMLQSCPQELGLASYSWLFQNPYFCES
jgi:hypothetical protein